MISVDWWNSPLQYGRGFTVFHWTFKTYTNSVDNYIISVFFTKKSGKLRFHHIYCYCCYSIDKKLQGNLRSARRTLRTSPSMRFENVDVLGVTPFGSWQASSSFRAFSMWKPRALPLDLFHFNSYSGYYILTRILESSPKLLNTLDVTEFTIIPSVTNRS